MTKEAAAMGLNTGNMMVVFNSWTLVRCLNLLTFKVNGVSIIISESHISPLEVGTILLRKHALVLNITILEI